MSTQWLNPFGFESVRRRLGSQVGELPESQRDERPTGARELSITRERRFRTSDRRLTQRDVDEWLSRLLLNLAEARELASKSDNEQFRLAVETLDGATLDVLRKLGSVREMPDVSDIVVRAIAEGGSDSSSLRLLECNLRSF